MKSKIKMIDKSKSFNYNVFHHFEDDFGFSHYKEFVDYYHFDHDNSYYEITFFDSCKITHSVCHCGHGGDSIELDVYWNYNDDIIRFVFNGYLDYCLFLKFLLDFVRDNIDLIYKKRKELKKIGRKEK